MKSAKFSYIYDFAFDLVDFSCEGEFRFKRSVELGEGMFLDFDENHLPVNLEIVSASKILGVEKEFLVNPDGNVTIIIGKDIYIIGHTVSTKSFCAGREAILLFVGLPRALPSQ